MKAFIGTIALSLFVAAIARGGLCAALQHMELPISIPPYPVCR